MRLVISVLVWASMGLALSGCAARVSTPGVQAEVYTPGVIVAPGPAHCPPGQAKKGRC